MTAASNSEARKREAERAEQAARSQKSALGAPNSPEAAGNASGAENAILSAEQRWALDGRIAADHWGYYLHFEPTGVAEVDRVLSAVGIAAKAYHHTDGWNDDLDWDYGPIPKGETCADFIQRVANDSAAIVREHRAEVLAEVERRIATSVSPNFALRPDGAEDPTAAAYVEGLHDAWATVRDYRQEQNHD